MLCTVDTEQCARFAMPEPRCGAPVHLAKMAPAFARPTDLASSLVEELRRRGIEIDASIVGELIDTLYFASLRTEEGQAIRCQVAYIDPKHPDPKPPRRIVKDRWQVTPLAANIEMTVTNLVKFATATDPRTSSLAVFPDDRGQLEIWGLVDQGNRYHDFINLDTESGPPPPGAFLATIDGPARLSARIRFKPVGTLIIDRLVVETIDVFRAGPVFDALAPGIGAYVQRARDAVGSEIFERREHWTRSLASAWLQSVRRILLRARQYGHGGAVLITPGAAADGLAIKYGLDYPRLATALDTRARSLIVSVDASDAIAEMMDDHRDDVPMNLHLVEAVEDNIVDETRSELDSTIWFISLLTRVDGLVLMNPSLGVQGFGVEVTVHDVPESIRLARDAEGTSTENLPYTQYGTRHRSMMRYCFAVPGSVGLVISQDSDVRVMTRSGDHLLVWENPLLEMQLDHG